LCDGGSFCNPPSFSERRLSPREWPSGRPRLDELLERFASEIEGFLNGGPNLKQKHLEEAKEAGLDPVQ
jgi:hypothetical protein